MNIIVKIIIVFFSIENAKGSEIEINWQDYCGKNKNHVLCYNETYDKNCDGKDLKVVKLKKESKSIISRFNKFRYSITSNIIVTKTFDDAHKEKEVDLGRKSSRMQEFKWDPFLEEMANRRCRICDYSLLNKPEDIKLKSFTPGEMIASPNHTGYNSPFVWKTTNDMLFAYFYIWYPELNKFDASLDNSHARLPFQEYVKKNPKGNELLHSTFQLMKDDHYLVGCAKSTYKEKEDTIYLYVCFTGASTVETTMKLTLELGNPASNCINEKKSSNIKYLGLCGSKNKTIFPFVIDKENAVVPIPTSSQNTAPSNPTTTSTTSTTTKTQLKSPTPKLQPKLPVKKKTQRPEITFNFEDEPSGGDESENDGSKSSTKRCYWSFIFSCFVFTAYMQ